jgi:hypothetical protein
MAGPRRAAGAIAVTTQPDPSSRADVEKVLEVENLTETYKVIAEWIRFADTKAGLTLTVNGILLGLLLPTLKSYLAETTSHPAGWWTGMVVVLFLVWLVLLVVSASSAFLCILPIRGLARQLALKHTPHFHPAAVAQAYGLSEVDRFVTDCERTGMEGLKREVMTAILVDSHLSGFKYGHVTRAIWLLGGSIIFGLLYLLAIQF